MLGGALQAQALAYLSLQQDADCVDLAGLRDLTKTASAGAALESMHACEHVLGGRAFHGGSRVNDARVNLHLFGVVEGEDDLILMGMVRDVTQRFVDRYLSPLLGVIQSVNKAPAGAKLDDDQRILRIGVSSLLRHPGRTLKAVALMCVQPKVWIIDAWFLANAVKDLVRLPSRLLPAAAFARYRAVVPPLRRYARYAERELRSLRWTYFWLSVFYQLELTRAQIPLQRLVKCIEHLVSMLAICHHASGADASMREVALLQAQLLKDKYRAIRVLSGLRSMQRTRRAVAAVGASIEAGECTLLDGVEPQAFGHSWDPPRGHAR
jgi:hypothetical protein